MSDAVRHDADWASKPYPWNEIGPRIAKEIRRQVDAILSERPPHLVAPFKHNSVAPPWSKAWRAPRF